MLYVPQPTTKPVGNTLEKYASLIFPGVLFDLFPQPPCVNVVNPLVSQSSGVYQSTFDVTCLVKPAGVAKTNFCFSFGFVVWTNIVPCGIFTFARAVITEEELEP